MRFSIRMSCLLLFCLCSSVQARVLEGAWQLVSGEYVDAEGRLVQYETLGLSAIKVLSATYFSFTAMKGDGFWASGAGHYRFENGEYSEVLQLNSFGEAEGKVYAFLARVEGDLWYTERWDGDIRVEYEVWRRLQ